MVDKRVDPPPRAIATLNLRRPEFVPLYNRLETGYQKFSDYMEQAPWTEKRVFSEGLSAAAFVGVIPEATVPGVEAAVIQKMLNSDRFRKVFSPDDFALLVRGEGENHYSFINIPALKDELKRAQKHSPELSNFYIPASNQIFIDEFIKYFNSKDRLDQNFLYGLVSGIPHSASHAFKKHDSERERLMPEKYFLYSRAGLIAGLGEPQHDTFMVRRMHSYGGHHPVAIYQKRADEGGHMPYGVDGMPGDWGGFKIDPKNARSKDTQLAMAKFYFVFTTLGLEQDLARMYKSSL